MVEKTINRTITTKEARFLAKMYNSLGIDLEDLYQLGNIKYFEHKIEEQNEILELQSKALTQANTEILKLKASIEELTIQLSDLHRNLIEESYGLTDSQGGNQ